MFPSISEPIREQRFDWWHGFRFCNWKTPWGAQYISFDHVHNMPISNYSNNMRKQQKSIRYKCRNYSQHATCFFSSFISRYLRLSFFGLFTMCEYRTGEIKYYVNYTNVYTNYTNVYLEGKEVANWGNVSHVRGRQLRERISCMHSLSWTRSVKLST